MELKQVKKKPILLFLIVSFGALMAIKIYNLYLGRQILGSFIGLNSPYLKLSPQKRMIGMKRNCPTTLSYPIGDVSFSLPSADTVMTYKKGSYYRSFKFGNNSHFVIFKDTALSNPLRALPQIESTDSVVVNDFLRGNGLTSSFDQLLYIYDRQPDDVPFASISRKDIIIQYSLIKLKDLNLGSGADRAFYFFISKHIKGFQYGSPGSTVKTFINLFTNKGDKYTLYFSGFAQEQIDCVVTSIDNSQ